MMLGGIRSLWDIRGLEQIQKVCSTHGVHFTAYGSLLRRLMLKLIATETSGDRWDLFDLVPFASDIDKRSSSFISAHTSLERARFSRIK
jgi:hypothetical protein